MRDDTQIIDRVKEQGVLPLFDHADEEISKLVVRTLYEAGVRIIEFTNRNPDALPVFKSLIRLRNEELPGLLLAAGTIRTEDDARLFSEAGADFLISPVFDLKVSDEARKQDRLWIPGCMTPTEIHVAENSGCKMVKLFPGNVLTPGFVSAVKVLFPAMMFMPTGGVEPTHDSLEQWFSSGVIAVGMGSKLIHKDMLAAEKMPELKAKTVSLLQLVKAVREAGTKK